jgi:ribosome-associated protein
VKRKYKPIKEVYFMENITTNPKLLAAHILRVLDDKKASDLKILHVEKQTILADYFIICSGSSNTQIKALAGEVEEKIKDIGLEPKHIEGFNEATWVVLDYYSVIVHIFNRESRSFYNLEKLWQDASEIDVKLFTETA